MADGGTLVLKGVPEELKTRLRVAAAQERCYPRDIAVHALEHFLAHTEPGAEPALPPYFSSGTSPRPAPANGGIPVPVLEALASAWEDQAAGRHREGVRPGEGAARDTMAACAQMLREAIAHAGQG